MGVLMLAIVVWQNSLVFHSLDKLTSIFIHVFPPLTLHLYRWGLIPCQAIHPDDTMSLSDITVLPLILYGLWQIGYLLATEVVLANKIRNDPTIVTSLRLQTLLQTFHFIQYLYLQAPSQGQKEWNEHVNNQGYKSNGYFEER